MWSCLEVTGNDCAQLLDSSDSCWVASGQRKLKWSRQKYLLCSVVCRESASVPLCSRQRLGLQEVHTARLPAGWSQRAASWRQTDPLLWGKALSVWLIHDHWPLFNRSSLSDLAEASREMNFESTLKGRALSLTLPWSLLLKNEEPKLSR